VRATVEPGATIDAVDTVAVTPTCPIPTSRSSCVQPDRYAIDDPDNGNWMTELARR